MAGKSLFDLGSGKVTAEPGTGGSLGGNPKPSDGPRRAAPTGDASEPLTIGDAFGASAADAIPDADADPDAPFGRFPDGTLRKRRARASAGTGPARKSATEQKGDLAGIESLLISIHLMGAVAMKQPGLALNEVEAKRLAQAIKSVQDQYPLVIDAKTQAWINLAAIGGMIYVPRVVALANAKKAARSRPAPAQPTPSADAVSPAPAPEPSSAGVAPTGHKGPLTPAQLFGPSFTGAE